MTQAQRDTQRALAAAKALLDGRDPRTEFAEVLTTLEHLVALVLLSVTPNDHRKAAEVLNEALVPGIEERLACSSARTQGARP